MTNKDSPNVSTCLTLMELIICRPNKMDLYLACLLVQKYFKRVNVPKMTPLGEIKTTPTP
jgi:hypothetical protein